MWFILALRLGGTVRELKSRMTHREFVWWRALFALSPFDDERCFDLPAAHVARELRVTRGKSASINDFMFYSRKPAEPLDEQSGGLMAYLHSRNTMN